MNAETEEIWEKVIVICVKIRFGTLIAWHL